MARQRFRKIKGMIKLAKKMGVDITADENIKAYLDYRDGTSTEYKTTPQPRGSSKPATLIPFYVRAFTVDFRHAIKFSGRAAAQLTSLGVTEAGLNIDTGSGDTAAQRGRIVRGFRPAKVIVTLSVTPGTTTTTDPVTGTTTTTVVTKKSGITLLDYKKRSGESYTLPFGAANAAGKKTYPEMTGTLLKEIGRGNVTVSFKQEKPGFA